MNELQVAMEYTFKDPDLLTLALTHRSFSGGKVTEDNEVLELLGDAVLGLVVAELLMNEFPEDGEGPLSRKRASLVNAETLAEIALTLDIAKHIRFGKGEAKAGGGSNPRLLASALEAVLGAVYKDSDIQEVKRLIAQLFGQKIRELSSGSAEFEKDYKTRLQELSQKLKLGIPEYLLLNSEGPDHQKSFSVEVAISGKALGRGIGTTKKAAERQAAQVAFEHLVNQETNS